MSLLSCRDLALGYEGKVMLAGVCFDVTAGDYLCVVGENGSGKSTLMKTLLRLRAPLAGSFETGDGLKPAEIGYLPQQTAAQKDFPASVREVVRSGLLGRHGLRPFYSRAEKRRADEMMERLGITGLAGRCYRELSGGQQQRALLARALCATTKLLLADEPAAGLDPAAAADMYALLEELHRDGVTIIMISHDMAAAVRYATHILHIGARSPLFFGPVAAYIESEIGKTYITDS